MIETFEVLDFDGQSIEYIRIINGDETTIMLKSTYDELQKQADQPIGGNI
jgi:hypothetical protein